MNSYHRSEKAHEKRERKRREAAERQENYQSRPDSFGLRQQVKAGLTDPAQVVTLNLEPQIKRWLATTGIQRYRKARKQAQKQD